MPQKRNRNGMQEYVPAGNGDPSGEYSDGEGNNKHFSSFKKPTQNGGDVVNVGGKETDLKQNEGKTQEATQTPQTTQTPPQEKKKEEQVVESPKQEETPPEKTAQEQLNDLKKDIEDNTIWNELTKKQQREIADHVSYYSKQSDEKTLKTLRYYTGNFGDLDGYTNEELLNLVHKIRGSEALVNDNEKGFIKKQGKWEETRRANLQRFLGNEVLSRDEMMQRKQEEAKQILTTIQTDTDKELEKNFNNGCAVCIGKNFPKDVAKQVNGAIQSVNKDFGGMADFVTAIGGRNELEKYINAMKEVTPPTEEEITNEMDRIKGFMILSGKTQEEKDQRAREIAIQNLSKPVKIDKANDAVAYWSGGITKRLVFMAKMKNFDDVGTEKQFNQNWWSHNKGIGVVYHEYGHGVDSMCKALNRKLSAQTATMDEATKAKFTQVDSDFRHNLNLLMDENKNKDFERELNERLNEKTYANSKEKEFARFVIETQMKNEGKKQYNLSKYGNSNSAEFVAESFAAHYVGMNNPLADKVVELYKNYYNDLSNIKKGVK